MERWAGKIAVITGASSGIGLAIAKALIRYEIIVVGLARRKSKMENEMKDVKKGSFYAIECDITIEEQVSNAFKWIKTNLNTVHILINNAGCIKAGKIPDVSFDELKKIIDVNLNGVILSSKSAIDIMKEGKKEESHIVMINSQLGHRVLVSQHSYNIYAATKHAVRALALTLENDLQGENIRVTNISPGMTKTEMFDSLCKDESTLKQVDTLLESEDIADAVLYVIGTPPRVLVEDVIIRPHKTLL